MTIEHVNEVDNIGIDTESDAVVLTLLDHLPWDEDSETHLLLLQDKLNSYLRFIESGELVESYPSGIGRRVEVNVLGKYPLNKDANDFFDNIKQVLIDESTVLKFELFTE